MTLKDNLGNELDEENTIGTIWYDPSAQIVCLLVFAQTWSFIPLTICPGYCLVTTGFSSIGSLEQHISNWDENRRMICIGRIEDLDIESFVAERYHESTI